MKDYFQGAGWETAADETRDYFRFHRQRYEYLLSLLDRLVPQAAAARPGESVRVVDIGLSPLTRAIAAGWPEASVDTLGFLDPRFRVERGQHYEWNLNEAQHRERWPAFGPWDIIVFAEVIEHLYTAPSLVLGCVASWLRPGGYLLLQTPNAASLPKRLRLLLGNHPYEMIRENATNPGHFREYTIAELKSLASQAGLDVIEVEARHYFRVQSWRARAWQLVSPYVPPSWREGITMILQKRPPHVAPRD